MAKKKIDKTNLETFAIWVKSTIGEASDEVILAWFEERNASQKKPADNPPAE
jgi:hypothetical protein